MNLDTLTKIEQSLRPQIAQAVRALIPPITDDRIRALVTADDLRAAWKAMPGPHPSVGDASLAVVVLRGSHPGAAGPGDLLTMLVCEPCEWHSPPGGENAAVHGVFPSIASVRI